VAANYFVAENKNATGVNGGNGTAAPFRGGAIETGSSRLSLVFGLVVSIVGSLTM